MASLDGHLPEPGGSRLALEHPALRLALPQVISGGTDSPHDRLQIRLAAPAKGRLCLMQDGRTLVSTRIDSLPERRLSLPLPATVAGNLTLTIQDRS
jgi:hypothetical protein